MTAPHQWKVLVLPLTLTRGDVSSLCSIKLSYFISYWRRSKAESPGLLSVLPPLSSLEVLASS